MQAESAPTESAEQPEERAEPPAGSNPPGQEQEAPSSDAQPANEEQAAEQAVLDFFEATLTRDFRGVCELLGPSSLAAVATGAGSSAVDRCVSRFEAFSRGGLARKFAEADLEVEQVFVNGDEAIARLRTAGGETGQLELVKVDGAWKANDDIEAE